MLWPAWVLDLACIALNSCIQEDLASDRGLSVQRQDRIEAVGSDHHLKMSWYKRYTLSSGSDWIHVHCSRPPTRQISKVPQETVSRDESIAKGGPSTSYTYRDTHQKMPDSLVDNKRVVDDSLERTKRDDSKSTGDGEKSREKQLIQCGGQPSEKCETIATAEQILAQTTSLSQVQLSFTASAIVTIASPAGSEVSN